MVNAILIVDDEPNVISALRRALQDEPYLIHSAGSGEEGLEIIQRHKIAVVVSDERMPGMSGVDFLSNVKRKSPQTIRIMLTGQASFEAAMDAVNHGEIFRFFTKPWDDVELKLSIRFALERYRLEEMNRQLLELTRRQAQTLKIIEQRYPEVGKLSDDLGDLPEQKNPEDIPDLSGTSS